MVPKAGFSTTAMSKAGALGSSHRVLVVVRPGERRVALGGQAAHHCCLPQLMACHSDVWMSRGSRLRLTLPPAEYRPAFGVQEGRHTGQGPPGRLG